jgi:hypothetical protein
VGDLVDDCRKVVGTASLIAPYEACDLLSRGATEIEKLRKEVKVLKAANASLATRNYLLALMLVGSVCGSFMAAFLMQ